MRSQAPHAVIDLAVEVALPPPATLATKPTKRPKADAIPITVTVKMPVAGIESSRLPVPPIPPLTGSHDDPVAASGKPLLYPIVIADRRNKRPLGVAPDTRIVWELRNPDGMEIDVFRYGRSGPASSPPATSPVR